DAVARLFRRRGGRRGLPAHGGAAVGTIETDAGEVLDEVILLRGERLEICGHGGAGAIARVFAALRSEGVEVAPPAPIPLTARPRTWLGFRVASWIEEGLLPEDTPLLAPLVEPRRVVLAGAPNAGKS